MGTQVLLSCWPSLRVRLAAPSKETSRAVAWKLHFFWRLKINNLLKGYSLFQGFFLFMAECSSQFQKLNNLERLVQLKVRWIQRLRLFSPIISEWYLVFFLFFFKALTLTVYRTVRAVTFAGDCKYTQLDEFTSAQCVLQDTKNSTRTDCDKPSGWRKFCLQWNFSSRLTVTNFSLNFAFFYTLLNCFFFQHFSCSLLSIFISYRRF